jgi:D-threo-aldose 1-dehydrogenase
VIIETRQLGQRGPLVTKIGLGCAPFGNLFTEVSDEDVQATVDTAWEGGVRFFDTAPLYGHGLSEIRLGKALAKYPREQYVLASKVGRLLREPVNKISPTIFKNVPDLEPIFDYGSKAVLTSIDESLDRLNVDYLDIVHVHDPDDHEDWAITEAFPRLIQLRDEGVIKAVGCGMNQTKSLTRFVNEVDLDCLLLAGRYTVLDHESGADLLQLCCEKNVGVVLGGIFNSGLLADPDKNKTFDYVDATPEILQKANAIAELARSHGFSLPHVAVQFGLRNASVASIVIGARTAREIGEDLLYATQEIPTTFWDDLQALS